MLSVLQLTNQVEQAGKLTKYYVSPRSHDKKQLLRNRFVRPTQNRNITKYRNRSKNHQPVKQIKAANIHLGSAKIDTPSLWVIPHKQIAGVGESLTPRKRQKKKQNIITHMIPAPTNIMMKTDVHENKKVHNCVGKQDNLLRLKCIPTLNGGLLAPREYNTLVSDPADTVQKQSSNNSNKLNTIAIEYNGVDLTTSGERAIIKPPLPISPRCRPKSAGVKILISKHTSEMISVTKSNQTRMRPSSAPRKRRNQSIPSAPQTSSSSSSSSYSEPINPFLVIGGSSPPVQYDTPSAIASPRIQTDSCQYNHVDGRTMSSYEMATTRLKHRTSKKYQKKREENDKVLRSPRTNNIRILTQQYVPIQRTSSRPTSFSRRPRSSSMARRGRTSSFNERRRITSSTSHFVKLM